MNTTALKVIAATLIAFSAIKLLFVLVDVRAWVRFARRLYANPVVTSVVALLLAAIVLYLLLAAGMSIVQILAVCVFVVLLLVVGIAPYANELFAWLDRQDLGAMIKRQWLYTLIWVALLAWGAVEIFSG